MAQQTTLPKTVEYRGCTATIYLSKNRNSTRFEVRNFDVDGTRQRTTFTTLADAEEFAEAAVRAIVGSRANFITLRGSEAHDYGQLLKSLQPTGMSLREAVGIVLEGRRLLDGSAGVLDAVRYYLDHRPRKSPDITVRQVMDELLALKQREGSVGPLHMRDLRNRLTRFAEKFNCPIARVNPPAIRDYILAQPVTERTQHNLRTTIALLFNYARGEGYLPTDHKGVPRPTKRRRAKVAVFG